MTKPILVTGAAGFIGFHLSRHLLKEGKGVVGLDNLNCYYDVQLKKERLSLLKENPRFRFVKGDIADQKAIEKIFLRYRFEKVLHMAAQAGVRYSRTHPHSYVRSNLVGFMNILEASRKVKAKHLVFASSSSVYGANRTIPFSEHQGVDHPVSLYAATKRAGELMAHAYSYLYGLPITALRYFTVYGPWGRPDMALFIFTKAILKGKPIEVFNHGRMKRDFTYIDDIVEATLRIFQKIPNPNFKWNAKRGDPATSSAAFRIYNIGRGHPVPLLKAIKILEGCLGLKAKKRFKGLEPGDVPQTYADTSDLAMDFGYKPKISLREGIGHFVEWYQEYYGARPIF